MPVRPPARPGVPRDFLHVGRSGGRRDHARRRAAPTAGAKSLRRAEDGRRRAASRRHRRLAAGKTVGVLSRNVLDHPRRQIRWLGGLDAARDFLCLRHLPCRRPRPWQGGDFVLPRRQPGDRAARHRAVVRLGADAVAGRGGDCRNLRMAAQRDSQNHVQCRKGDRDRQLRPDRGVRRKAGLDQGRRLYRCAAGAAAGARTGGRRASSRS